MYQVELYADGACSGNPGPAGIGVVLKSGKHRKELGTAIGEATNNIAELRAVIEGIKLLKTLEQTELVIYTDSQLVEGLLTKNWNPKANQELINEMKGLVQKCRSFKVVKVKGHNGVPENEACHILAQAALKAELEPKV